MPNMKYLVPAVFAATVVAHDIRTQIQARKFRLAASEVIAHEEIHRAILTAENEALDARYQYVCHKLAANGIEPDEFDIIALNNLDS